MTALELQSGESKRFVIERNPGTTQHPKMDVTNCRSMEHFRGLGVAERIRDVASRAALHGRRLGHSAQRVGARALSYPDVHTRRARIGRRTTGHNRSSRTCVSARIVFERVLRGHSARVTARRAALRRGARELVQDEGRRNGNRPRRRKRRHLRRAVRTSRRLRRRGGVVREALGFAWEGQFNIARFYMCTSVCGQGAAPLSERLGTTNRRRGAR